MLTYCMISYLYLEAYWICDICEVSAVDAQGISCVRCAYECDTRYCVYRITSVSIGVSDRSKSSCLCLSRYLYEAELCNLLGIYSPICSWRIEIGKLVLMSYKLSRRSYQVVYIIPGGLQEICVCA